MGVKNQVFSALDRIAKPGAVLATNTSYLDVNAIARITARPDAVVGMHFFSPANVMRLLEIVRGEKTSPQALATAVGVGRKIGKAPVVVEVCHGFVGNRMHRIRSVETERVLLEGPLPQEIDAAMTAFGFAMGPLAVSDLAGLDISWRMRKAEGFSAPIADQLCELALARRPGAVLPLRTGLARPSPMKTWAIILATAYKLGVRGCVQRKDCRAPAVPDDQRGACISTKASRTRRRHRRDLGLRLVPVGRGGPMHTPTRSGSHKK